MEQKPIKILYQPLKAKYYRMIESGEKPGAKVVNRLGREFTIESKPRRNSTERSAHGPFHTVPAPSANF